MDVLFIFTAGFAAGMFVSGLVLAGSPRRIR